MFKNVIRFLAEVAVETILATVGRIIVATVIAKVVTYFMREDEIVETHEFTNSED